MSVFGIDSVAFAAKASDETLAALDSAQAEYEAALAELSSIGSQLEDAQYKLSECEGDLAATNEQITQLEASITEKQAELAEAQEVLAERVGANYRAGSTNMLDVILNATSFDDFVSRVYYATKVSDSDAAAIQNVKDIKAELESEEAALQEQRATQEQLLAEQQAYTDELASTVAYYEEYTASLSSEVTALMEQAQAELIAAQQAEYEAYVASQQAAQSQDSADSSQGPSDYSDNGSYDDGGSSYDGGGSSDWSDSGDNSYSGGNHVPAAASAAWNYIGLPYVWGGTGPDGYDCSGLAQRCYADAGYSIGRDTYAQAANISSKGQMVYDMGSLQAGDLVFPHSGHVGIYMGGGMMIHAPEPGRYVEYASVYAFSFGGCPV